jgi:hypothetical protein
MEQVEKDGRLAILHAMLALKSQNLASDDEVTWARKWFDDRKIQLVSEPGTGRFVVVEPSQETKPEE